jgi:hypothetical protein
VFASPERGGRFRRGIPVLRVLVLLLSVSTAAVFAGSAHASQLIDRDATGVRLAVTRDGKTAVLTYRAHGRRWRVRAWGAINARFPNPPVPQVQFRIRRDGKPIRNWCRRYDGPRLANFVVACKAPDGSYWAVQRFRRRLPNLGFLPWLPEQHAWAYHLSHWTGPLAVLEGWSDWAWSGRFHHLFGRLTYRGRPVHGFRTNRYGSRLDKYGALVYVDTLGSVYGRGWRRENSFVTHRPTGTFCYTFRARDPGTGGYAAPPSWPRGRLRGPGNGKRYLLTVEGPGVTPDLAIYLDGLENYNRSNARHVEYERAMNALQDHVMAGDPLCRKH